ncbi:MAG: hypothetical protein ACHRXM_30845 [Isosphaerales bacterium]
MLGKRQKVVSGFRSWRVIHAVEEAFPMWEEQKRQRFQQLRQRQREKTPERGNAG